MGNFSLLTLTPLSVNALPAEKVPKPLQPWVDWVLEDDTQLHCPFFYNDTKTKYCAWPSQLNLDIQKQQGKFTSNWQIYNKSYITLPGNPDHWPQNVTVNNKPALVISYNNNPAIKLDAGHYQIQASFFWDHTPESLAIPTLTGIISVRVLNKSIAYPTIKNQQLWFNSMFKFLILRR
ncbi:hypothetical protein [Bathymodiolus japonicus methanotrophic gill symbiont]|uniref:hypothetical protein n=1 Tax=Bathymodiolus japonicus methanotrophic gill symbiont TaxID=113269 RepID=UPI001C8DAE6A|nr:hypothetical protein [Bathymodiolus japonicus methanotrophic gill symbiont]